MEKEKGGTMPGVPVVDFHTVDGLKTGILVGVGGFDLISRTIGFQGEIEGNGTT